MMLRRLMIAFGLPVTLLVACSLPNDERANVYDRDDLPEAIANTTTTTTTTTSTTTTTTIPTSTDISTPVEATVTTTTLPPTLTAPVDLFYTIGLTNDINRLRREFNEDASVSQVLQQLEQPSQDVAGFGLRTAVRNGMVDADRVMVDRGMATVPLNPAVVDLMSETVLRRAIAQIVLTLSSFQTFDAGNISSVLFVVDGENFPVFVPAFGGTSEEGEALFFEDFEPLIASSAGPPSTTASTSGTTTPSTVPETTEPDDTTPDDTTPDDTAG